MPKPFKKSIEEQKLSPISKRPLSHQIENIDQDSTDEENERNLETIKQIENSSLNNKNLNSLLNSLPSNRTEQILNEEEQSLKLRLNNIAELNQNLFTKNKFRIV